MQVHKSLYYQIPNLEKHPRVLSQAPDILISFFTEVVNCSQHASSQSILAIKDRSTLLKFLHDKDQKIIAQWEHYFSPRKSGKPREMFKGEEHAKWWLRQCAPVKFVDAAWLGYIHKVTTPFALRSITKNVWRILSEELGNGDLAKNHVPLFRNLMTEINHTLPEEESHDFIKSNGLDTRQVWEAAVAQLRISLFPHGFLPEILGFNMHFEMLTWDSLVAIKKLKQLSINKYYFLLHVSIDNADSDHTAMAAQSVTE
ncbi:MAG: hypothetical protein Q9170_004721 [Blastenia crenularia]